MNQKSNNELLKKWLSEGNEVKKLPYFTTLEQTISERVNFTRRSKNVRNVANTESIWENV